MGLIGWTSSAGYLGEPQGKRSFPCSTTCLDIKIILRECIFFRMQERRIRFLQYTNQFFQLASVTFKCNTQHPRKITLCLRSRFLGTPFNDGIGNTSGSLNTTLQIPTTFGLSHIIVPELNIFARFLERLRDFQLVLAALFDNFLQDNPVSRIVGPQVHLEILFFLGRPGRIIAVIKNGLRYHRGSLYTTAQIPPILIFSQFTPTVSAAGTSTVDSHLHLTNNESSAWRQPRISP